MHRLSSLYIGIQFECWTIISQTSILDTSILNTTIPHTTTPHTTTLFTTTALYTTSALHTTTALYTTTTLYTTIAHTSNSLAALRMPASFSNSQNSQAAAPGPHTQALLERYNVSDSFPVPPPFSQEEIDSLDKQQMHALLSSMASQPYQTAASPSEDNLSATKPFELSPLLAIKLLIMVHIIG